MEGTGLTHFVLLNYSDEFIIRNVDVSLHEKKKNTTKIYLVHTYGNVIKTGC